MKKTTQFKRLGGIASAALLLTLSVVHAGPIVLELQPGVIGSGGGTSSGGDFSVTGTIGEIGTGYSAGGTFELEGGFLAMFTAVQMEGAPTLTLTRAGGTVVLSWPASATDFELEKTGEVANLNSWSAAGGTVTMVGDNYQVSFPTTGSSQFFRLKQVPR